MKILISEGQAKLLKEYLSNQMVSLKQYFSMSEEERKANLPETYINLFKYFVEDSEVAKEFWQKYNGIYDDLLEHLKTQEPIIYSEFANYLYDGFVNDMFSNIIAKKYYPTWYFFSNVQLVKNQWMIHFTNDANSISKDGFKYGVDDMTQLGLTNHMEDFEKEMGGYNFAFDFKTAIQQTIYGGSTYGSEAVVFKASGLQMYHKGDREYQTIFYGNTARNIIRITQNLKEQWAIKNIKTGRILFETGHFREMLSWINTNYDQYRTVLHY